MSATSASTGRPLAVVLGGIADATRSAGHEKGSQEDEQRLAHVLTGAQVPRVHVLRVLAGQQDTGNPLDQCAATRSVSLGQIASR